MDTRHNLNRLAYFVAVVEEGTITAAADRLGLSKAVVSKQLQLLEEDLGVALLLRNTRHMRTTEVGLAFYEKSKNVLIQADDAFNTVLEHGQIPTGKIRVTAPVDFGVTFVSPLIAQFQEHHPRVSIELVLSDKQLDIVEQRYDIAFRVGWLEDSSNLARKLKSFHEIVVCSTETAKQFDINIPTDLAILPFVANQAIGNKKKWTFNRANTKHTVEMQIALSSNVTLALRSSVMNGGFFTILPDILVTNELASGELIQLLPDWKLPEGGVYLVSPPNRLRTSAVQALMDMAQVEISSV